MDEAGFRKALQRERAATVARLEQVQSDFEGMVEDSLNSNADDEHDPEGATIAYERAQVTALLASAQSNLDALDLAISRLSEATYSVCERCGGKIAPERLDALPAARTCISCAGISQAPA